MIKQRTVKETVTIEGSGLQTGKRVKLTLKPSPPDSSINIIRVDLPNKPLLNIRSFDMTKALPDPAATKNITLHRTVLALGPLAVQTTEHLLSALAGLAIDNIVIEIDNEELPGLDGSAKNYTELIKRAGIAEQDAPRRFFKTDKVIWCEEGGSFLAIFPSEEFRISFTLSYRSPNIGSQFLSLAVDENNFESEIAPARTFCAEEEALALLKMGLGKGANYNNTLVLGAAGPINTTLRFPDEPVRHKILDLIGDLYILGMPVKGHVVAIKSGHKLNMEMVRKLKQLI